MDDKDYFLRRAAEEVDAANRTDSLAAKRAHLELADLYLLEIENSAAPLETSALARTRHLSA
jgi:hypothetical protein